MSRSRTIIAVSVCCVVAVPGLIASSPLFGQDQNGRSEFQSAGVTDVGSGPAVLIGGVIEKPPADAWHFRPAIKDREPGGCDLDPDDPALIDIDVAGAPRGVMAGSPWPGGVVYYAFGVNTTPDMQAAAIEAMDELASVAQLTFLPATQPTDGTRIVFWDSDRNSSPIGWVPSLVIQGNVFAKSRVIRIRNWNSKATIMHEIMHSLSVKHEQSRSDRDDYVTVVTGNIKDGKGHNFSKTSGPTFGDYDFASIMHYHNCAFSDCEDPGCSIGTPSNGPDPEIPGTEDCYTLFVNPPYDTFWQSRIGRFGALSHGDVETLRAIYGHRWAHDECDDAKPISGVGTFEFDNRYATESGMTAPACFFNGDTSIDRDVWFRWTCPVNGIYELNSCMQSSANTKIAVYATGNCPFPNNMTACDDDSCGSINAKMTFAADAGEQFMIQVGLTPIDAPEVGDLVRLGTRGSFTISRIVFNNTCEEALAIGGNNLTIPYDNTLATENGLDAPLCEFFGFDGIEHDLWWRWTPLKSGAATLTTCGLSSVDTKVAVYAGTSCPQGGGILACDDDSCGAQSTATWEVIGGATYLLRIGVYENATPQPGMFNVFVSEFSDNCGDPEIISGDGLFGFDTSFATVANNFNATCGEGSAVEFEGDVWYRWSTSTTSNVTVRTCGFTPLDTAIGVYDGCPELIDALFGIDRVVGCGDDDCGVQSSVDFVAIAGREYLFRVGTSAGVPGGAGQFEVISSPYLATNDECVDALSLEGNSLSIHGTFAGSEYSGFADDCASVLATNSDVYYAWTSPGVGTLRVKTCGSSDYPALGQGPSTILSLHTDCPPSTVNMLTCNEIESANDPRLCPAGGTTFRDAAVSLPVVANETVIIRVAKNVATGGGDDFFLSLSYVGLPQIVDSNVILSTVQPGSALANLVLINPLDEASNELVAGMPLTDPGDLPPSLPLYPFDDQVLLPLIDDGDIDILNLFTTGIESSGTYTLPNDVVAVINHEEQFAIFDHPGNLFANPLLLGNPALFGAPFLAATAGELTTANPLVALYSQGFTIALNADNPSGGIGFSLIGLVGNAVSAAMPLVPVQGGVQTVANNYPLVILDQGGAGFGPGLVAVDFDANAFDRIEANNWSFVPNTMTTVPGESDQFYIAGGTGLGRGGLVPQVIRFGLDGVTEVIAEGGDLANPTDIAVEADGNILVADPDAFDGAGALFRIYTGIQAEDDDEPNADPPSGASPAGGQLVVVKGNETIGDQFVRPVGVTVIRCETVEYDISPSQDLTDLNPGNGQVTTILNGPALRAGIQEANASPCDNGVILRLESGQYNLTVAGSGEDASATGDLDVTGYIRIQGAGVDQTTITMLQSDRVFEVHPGATLVLSDLTISGGTGDGAGIRNRGQLAMHRVRVAGNIGAGGAGGVRNDATMLAVDCQFDGNISASNGGGIGSFGAGASTRLMRCLIVDNNTSLNGAGIAIGSNATLDMENCTVSNNKSEFSGGGVFCNNGIVNIDHCTVAYNMADNDMNGGGDGGGLRQSGGTINLGNSIVAYNTRNGNIRSDLGGTITSSGYNNIREVSPAFIVGNLAGNITGFGPNLLPLADNGGATMTHGLAVGSIGIDDADPNACIPFDQRHKFRPYDGDNDGIARCDMGAFEFRGRTGDVNCDGNVDGLDVQAFVLAILHPSQYEQRYLGCDINNADADSNGQVEWDDVASLVSLMLGN